MNDVPEIRTVTVERDFAYPPEKLWRVLTEPALIEEWIGMKTDFALQLGKKFDFTGEWGGVNCEVVEIDPPNVLAYKWDAMGLFSTVTWTLEPTGSGTRLRMEQEGFKPDQDFAYQGARQAWPGYFDAIEGLLAKGA